MNPGANIVPMYGHLATARRLLPLATTRTPRAHRPVSSSGVALPAAPGNRTAGESVPTAPTGRDSESLPVGAVGTGTDRGAGAGNERTREASRVNTRGSLPSSANATPSSQGRVLEPRFGEARAVEPGVVLQTGVVQGGRGNARASSVIRSPKIISRSFADSPATPSESYRRRDNRVSASLPPEHPRRERAGTDHGTAAQPLPRASAAVQHHAAAAAQHLSPPPPPGLQLSPGSPARGSILGIMHSMRSLGAKLEESFWSPLADRGTAEETAGGAARGRGRIMERQTDGAGRSGTSAAATAQQTPARRIMAPRHRSCGLEPPPGLALCKPDIARPVLSNQWAQAEYHRQSGPRPPLPTDASPLRSPQRPPHFAYVPPRTGSERYWKEVRARELRGLPPFSSIAEEVRARELAGPAEAWRWGEDNMTSREGSAAVG